MNATTLQKSLAFIALAAVAACSGPNAASTIPAAASATQTAQRPGVERPHVPHLWQTFVGVGDSLTAGYQSNGYLGQSDFKDPLVHGVIVPPTQENGWWTLVDEQISGKPLAQAIADEFDPKVSPLPLIAAPGLNNQLVPQAPLFNNLKPNDACKDYDGFNAKGYLLSGNPVTRMNPSSTTLRDMGVPGITAHEVNVMSEPQTNTCEPLPGIPGLLSAVTQDESSDFWPVLGNFAGMGYNLSEVRAAASRHPTLATVWIGANDVLKFMGSGGRFVGGDRTVGQISQDVHQAVQTLQYAGAKVVVFDLPNVLEVPYFQRTDNPANPAKDCNEPGSALTSKTYVLCTMLLTGAIPPTTAPKLVDQIAAMYHLQTTNCVPASTTHPCGYLTLQGTLETLDFYEATTKLADLDCEGTDFTPPCVAGSGLGTYYITPPFASQIQALNNVINQGIDSTARNMGVALVPIAKIFDGLASGDKSNPYFETAATIGPSDFCCTIAWGGGLLSNDSIHPSNTGYALIAYFAIQTMNARYHAGIPEVNYKDVYDGKHRCSVPNYCYPDPYAPPYSFTPH